MVIKRLFFGLEVNAPWINPLPAGRIIVEDKRHITLAFLGNISFSELYEALPSIPKPNFRIGYTGIFDRCLFLPRNPPNVIAFGIHFLGDVLNLYEYQKTLLCWLKEINISLDDKKWLPHVTLARKPFDSQEWLNHFTSLPFYTSHFHLYESKGNLNYESIWTFPIQAPFEELDHTADIAFMIYGNTIKDLYFHAFTALAFKEPHLIEFFEENVAIDSLEDLIFALNQCIAITDSQRRCCLKAVSYHGEIISNEQKILQWEMIVDV